MSSSRKDESFPRRYPAQPVVAVSAVVLNHEERILLVRRANPPGKGRWSLPGGAVRVGEPILEALKREVKEECGLEIRVVQLLAVHDRIFRDSRGAVEYHYVIINYLARAEGVPVPGGDVVDVRWLPVEEMMKMELTPGIRELVEKTVGTCCPSRRAEEKENREKGPGSFER